MNGPSGTGVDDLFTPEERSFRGLKNTELYDDLKVAAILNEINGRDYTGTREMGVPTIFGMNFQERGGKDRWRRLRRWKRLGSHGRVPPEDYVQAPRAKLA